MQKKSAVMCALIFLGIGEAVVRFDAATLLFSSTRTQTVANTFGFRRDSDSVNKVDAIGDTTELRVMVLGDSHLYGLGMPPQAAFSRQLQKFLNERKPDGKGGTRVLDLTVPGANTYYNLVNFRTYAGNFRPHIVILNYNHNDVYGRQTDKSPEEQTPAPRSVEPPGIIPEPGQVATPFLQVLKAAINKSALLEYVSARLNTELRLAGFVIPGTEFHHLISQSHQDDFVGWQVSRNHLTEMIESSGGEGMRFVAHLMPQLEMLDNYVAFTEVDKTIERFFLGAGSEFVPGVAPFLPTEGQTYAISKYDGHPNERAHSMMARKMCDYLLDSDAP